MYCSSRNHTGLCAALRIHVDDLPPPSPQFKVMFSPLSWCLGCHCKASLQILHQFREVPLPLPVEKGCSASGRHRHHTATLALPVKAEANQKELEKQGPAVHTLSAS